MNTENVLAAIAGLITGLLAFILKKRLTSGSVAVTDAESLWNRINEHVTRLEDRLIISESREHECQRATDTLRHRVEKLEHENWVLREQVNILEEKNSELHERIGELSLVVTEAKDGRT